MESIDAVGHPGRAASMQPFEMQLHKRAALAAHHITTQPWHSWAFDYWDIGTYPDGMGIVECTFCQILTFVHCSQFCPVASTHF